MYVIIAGGGTMGREIARALPDHEIVIVEKNREVCERDTKELNATIVNGDCTRIHVMEEAEFDKADAVIAVTNSDEVNLLVALYAKKKKKHVIVRVKEPEYTQLFEELGIKDIISPERRAAMDIANKVVWK
ncbi:MAG: TrkA family potassium uptake protein [Candidatus Altiarchaeota archaeon]